LMVPFTIAMPLDGSFALASPGSLRMVQEPILNSLASKQIVDIGLIIAVWWESFRFECVGFAMIRQ